MQDWIGIPAGAAAGTVFYQLELSNISRRACTLLGFPGVSAVSANGAPLGSPAERDGSHPARLVTLGPGATAHVELGNVEVVNFPAAACHPVTPSGLRVFAPGDFRSETIPLRGLGACQRPGRGS